MPRNHYKRYFTSSLGASYIIANLYLSHSLLHQSSDLTPELVLGYNKKRQKKEHSKVANS